MKKFYIRINGELMEVDYKVYREYYYGKRKEKYFMFDLKWGGIKQKGGKNKLVREISLESLWVIIPGISEPPVRTLRATIPENERHIFR